MRSGTHEDTLGLRALRVLRALAFVIAFLGITWCSSVLLASAAQAAEGPLAGLASGEPREPRDSTGLVATVEREQLPRVAAKLTQATATVRAAVTPPPPAPAAAPTPERPSSPAPADNPEPRGVAAVGHVVAQAEQTLGRTRSAVEQTVAVVDRKVDRSVGLAEAVLRPTIDTVPVPLPAVDVLDGPQTDEPVVDGSDVVALLVAGFLPAPGPALRPDLGTAQSRDVPGPTSLRGPVITAPDPATTSTGSNLVGPPDPDRTTTAQEEPSSLPTLPGGGSLPESSSASQVHGHGGLAVLELTRHLLVPAGSSALQRTSSPLSGPGPRPDTRPG